MNKEEAIKLLEEKEQSHIMRGFDELPNEKQEHLLKQIEAIDWDMLALVGKEKEAEEGDIEPLGAVDISEINNRREEFTEEGIKGIRAGKLGAVLLAGGMGTRLGLDKPKGELNVGINKDLCIFNCLINNLLEVTDKAGSFIPLYIMTSEKNNDETIRFFEEKDYFGYPSEYVNFFIQEMAPAVDYSGKLLLEEPGSLATSPNGNGGWFSSMVKAGLLEDINKRGVEWLNVFAVDNVLQRIGDPSFFGATLLSNTDSGSKVVSKVDAYEKMGILCSFNGHPQVVEYYELSKEMAESVDENGE
ncbi:MAG: UTP--glucose-1-phosphate uridylyltransferase, partial [Lachnospiraceae bacterium]|nr:UTP--glucose-1-phosphate uridylyltransferase [Lachnospiraceae bacterium]